MNVLGIESSCDETSVSILSDGKLKANLISSQDFHAKYGGVIPELSSRAHLQIILPLLKTALEKAEIKKEDINVVSATAGPGLIGALLVGLTFAKGLAFSLNIPFIPVNHIEGHIFSGFLMEEKPEFPYLCLVVSGGHTLLLLVKSDLEIYKLGSTIDDAVGEAFDKVAKMLGFEYPGGPLIQKYAEIGNPKEIKFPIARLKNKYDLSFSGLKTSVLRYIQKLEQEHGNVTDIEKENISASFQKAIIDALTRKVILALNEFEVASLSLVGGVAANTALRESFVNIGRSFNKKVVIPDLSFCGDNAAMIAYRGMRLNQFGKHFNFDYNAFARMPVNTFKTFT